MKRSVKSKEVIEKQKQLMRELGWHPYFPIFFWRKCTICTSEFKLEHGWKQNKAFELGFSCPGPINTIYCCKECGEL